MIRGSQKKVLFIEGSESSLFESAYFVLRKSAEDSGASHDDMVREANRIIEERVSLGRSRRRDRRIAKIRTTALFLLGSLAGGGASALLFLLLS